jgi:hypothetical protein
MWENSNILLDFRLIYCTQIYKSGDLNKIKENILKYKKSEKLLSIFLHFKFSFQMVCVYTYHEYPKNPRKNPKSFPNLEV